MIYLIIATICFSLSFGLIKSQLATIPSEFVVFSRLLLASLFFLPFISTKKSKKHILASIIGIIQFGIMYLCFIKAFQYLQGNEIALLTTTTPIFVAIWSSLFGEKFKFSYIICILMSVIGAGIIVWQNISFDMIVKGVVLMETTNCSFALGQVLWKKYIGDTSAKYMSSAYLGASLFVLPFVLSNMDITTFKITIPQILSICYLAIIPTGIGFWLWNRGSIGVKYSTLAIMNNLKIPLAVLFAIFIFHEKINITNFICGSIIILLSIIFLHSALNPQNKNQQSK